MLRQSLKRVQQTATQPFPQDLKIKKIEKQEEPLGLPREEHSESEHVLETLVLGCDHDVVENISESIEKEKLQNRKHKRRQHLHEVLKKEKHPVWEDEDDKNIKVQYTKSKKSNVQKKEELISGEEYEKKLKTEFEKVTSTPNWARLKYERDEASSDDSDVEELLKSTGDYLITSSSLPKNILQMKRCTDVNKSSSCSSKIKAVEFHPSAQVALTGGLDQRLCFYQIDGKDNPEIQSVFIDKFPIYSAHFSTDGQEAIVSSKLKAFYYYDMIAGRIVNVPWIKACEETNMRFFEVSPDGRFIVFRGEHGRIHLLSSKTKELIHTLKMNGSCHSVCFTKDGKTMYSFGDDADVYVWDMDTRDCIHKFVDDGCLHGRVVAASDNKQYLACGSDSGVVNIYDVGTCLNTNRPKPLKSIMNLTTSCTYAKFNSKTEILAVASNYMERGVKLIHLPSLTVFSNFPHQNVDREIRIPLSMDFSVNSGYFTVANNAGKALLYRVKHYGNY